MNFVIDPVLLRRVDDFWHRNGIANRAATVKWLLDWALIQNPKPDAELRQRARANKESK